MPNLLLFAPCEKVIVDQNNTASLISVLEEVKVQIVGGAPPVPNTIVPMQWSIVSLWEQSSAWDMGRTFEQRTALVSAAGAHLAESIGTFVFEKPRHRIITQILGMPLTEPGQHKVKIWIRDKADPPKEWKETASFPITIELLSPPTTPTATIN